MLKRGMDFMNAGVSTACLYPNLVEDCLYNLVKRDVKLVEIFLNTDCELKKPFILELKSMIDEYCVKVSSIHPYTCGIEPMMFFTNYERRFIDVLDYYKRYFEAMNLLGAEILIFHGNKNVNPFPNEKYFERFAIFSRLARENGVMIAQENVARCSSGKLSFLKEMSDYLGDEVSFVLDTKQAVRAGENAFEILEELKQKVVHIHYSDSGEKGDCLLYGDGEFESLNFFKALSNIGFTKSIILELYSNNYSSCDELASNYHTINNLLKTI